MKDHILFFMCQFISKEVLEILQVVKRFHIYKGRTLQKVFDYQYIIPIFFVDKFFD